MSIYREVRKIAHSGWDVPGSALTVDVMFETGKTPRLRVDVYREMLYFTVDPPTNKQEFDNDEQVIAATKMIRDTLDGMIRTYEWKTDHGAEG